MARPRARLYDRSMEPRSLDEGARYRHLEPPVPLDQMIESIDVSPHADPQDDAYREQEWLIRHLPG